MDRVVVELAEGTGGRGVGRLRGGDNRLSVAVRECFGKALSCEVRERLNNHLERMIPPHKEEDNLIAKESAWTL